MSSASVCGVPSHRVCTAEMKLYAAVRTLRGLTLGAATQSPAAAVVTEAVSMVPLFRNATSATLGGIAAVLYSGSEYAAETLELLERPMRSALELECVMLVLTLIAMGICARFF